MMKTSCLTLLNRVITRLSTKLSSLLTLCATEQALGIDEERVDRLGVEVEGLSNCAGSYSAKTEQCLR